MLSSKQLLSFLALCGITLLLLVAGAQIARFNALSIVRPSISVKESFEDKKTEVVGSGAVSAVSPAPADLENERLPYHLLRGVLPDAAKDEPTQMNAEACYNKDFQTKISPTGNFRQLTNNYKRAAPDSCSGWEQEFVGAFYKGGES
jgi:hypothetical protein